MLTNDEYEVLFSSWKSQHGVEAKSKRYGTPYMSIPKNPVARRAMLQILIDTLIYKHGYTESDFGHFTKSKIIETCVFADYEDKEQLRKWRKAVESDLNHVLGISFKKEFTVKNREMEVRPQESDILEYVAIPDDAPVELKNPIDKAKLVNAMSAPKDVIDEEFLKLIQGNSNE